MSTWAQMPRCYHITRKGVQVSWCPFSVGRCGLQGSGSGGVQTQVRMSQLSSRKTEGKAFSLGWSQASAPPQRNVASMAVMSSHSTPEWGFSLGPPEVTTSGSTTRTAHPVGALAPCPFCQAPFRTARLPTSVPPWPSLPPAQGKGKKLSSCPQVGSNLNTPAHPSRSKESLGPQPALLCPHQHCRWSPQP